ncbi:MULTISPECIES: hypothetical protein [unclassified Cryobacterium]|uniref:hypothetical protein n=1 Tax=unclassified Cryobacterium TaxID=2649013 RepID=UPI0014458975|nr:MULTISPECIES: hypothetical protein [unclassified Cryobacterium]
MTLWDLLTIAVRRWYVTLAGLALTGVAIVWVMQAPPVYFAQASVVLLPPESAVQNAYSDAPRSLIDLAGAVAASVQGSGGDASDVSDRVTIVGEGYREGYLVRQPSVGSQWEYRFEDPVLEVQAVANTPDGARAQMEHALDTVQDTIDEFQDEQQLDVASRVRTQLVPSEPQLSEVGGNTVRGVGLTALAGLLATLAVLGTLGRPRRKPGRSR